MRSARNPMEFERDMNRIIGKELVPAIVKQTLTELTNYVSKEWYGSSPNEYNRTFDFFKSLISSDIERVANKFVSQIFSDPSKIRSQIDDDSMFNQHMSFDGSGSNWIPETMAQFIEEGNKSSAYSYDGIFMFKETSKWLNSNLYRIVRETFRKFGIKVIRTN